MAGVDERGGKRTERKERRKEEVELK